METKLISSKDIILKSWDLYSKNFRLFIKPILIILAASIVLTISQYFFIEPTAEYPSGLMFVPFILLVLIFAFVYLWIYILVIKQIDLLYKNKPIDLKQLIHESLIKIPSFFMVGIIMGLTVAIGLILLIVPGIIFAVWYYFSTYANALEEKNDKGLDALKSSKELVQGRWSKVFWRLVVPYLAIYVPIAILGIIIMGVISIILISLNFNDDQALLILTPFNIIFDIINLCLIPLYICFSVILYNNLKETKVKPIQVQA